MVGAPFYELDGQIAVELPGARAIFTMAAWGDVRETDTAAHERFGISPARALQVHGTAVVETDVAPLDPLREADAVMTSTRGIAAMVIAADCVPIVISDGRTVAAVHAGWKGLRDGVITSAVSAVDGTVAAAGERPLAAAIGPCAGACCYEVSDQLHETFASRGQDFRNGQNLDLNAIARQQLADAGVETIHDVSLCTICSSPDQLFSYRRDGGQTGRQGALIWLT